MEPYIDDKKGRARQIIGWIVDITVVLAVAWFTVFLFGTQIQIAGQSMSPVLESEDIVLMNRLSFQLRKPKRFDIAVFRKEDQKWNVKRILGLPGETLEVRDGLLYIDGKLLESRNSLNKVALAGLLENPVMLGDDEYFVMGDYRENSEDSRFANVGNIKREQIVGKVWFRIYPLSRFKLIHP